MNPFVRCLLVVFFAVLFIGSSAQKSDSTTTIVLVRHAEKDTAKGNDPDLSAVGLKRAQSLRLALKDIVADELYSTSYKRTKQTLKPWSDFSGKEIRIYNPQNLEGFAQQLKSMKGKTIVVAGHSDTTPMLVNLLIGAAKYKQLEDQTYNKIFIVTINSGVITDKVIEY